MSFISSFEIIKVVFPDPNILCIPVSAIDGFANGLIAFFINGNPVFRQEITSP